MMSAMIKTLNTIAIRGKQEHCDRRRQGPTGAPSPANLTTGKRRARRTSSPGRYRFNDPDECTDGILLPRRAAIPDAKLPIS
jgi:hypothetical protein